MLQVLRGVNPAMQLDVRELLIGRRSMEASHERGIGDRITAEELIADWVINENVADPEPQVIGLFDDVLTHGEHFRAACSVLSDRFPHARIVGFFVARCVPPND